MSEGPRTVYGLDPAWRDGPAILMEATVHPDGKVEINRVTELEFKMPIDDPVKLLVHNVLFEAAKEWSPKGSAALAELYDRGDYARADVARFIREEKFAANIARRMEQYSYVYGEAMVEVQKLMMQYDSPA